MIYSHGHIPQSEPGSFLTIRNLEYVERLKVQMVRLAGDWGYCKTCAAMRSALRKINAISLRCAKRAAVVTPQRRAVHHRAGTLNHLSLDGGGTLPETGSIGAAFGGLDRL